MEIFKNKPFGWGLRGDPELWDELAKRLEKFDTTKNLDEFVRVLDYEFNEILKRGKKISKNVVWFEEFSQAGLSGGSVSLQWWENNGLPLLKKRYSESLKKN